MIQKIKSDLVIIEEDSPSFITPEKDKYEEMFDEAMENAQLNWNKKYEEIKWRN
mgnify:FL=1